MATVRQPDVRHTDSIAESATVVIGGTSGIGFAVASAATAASGSVFISSSSVDKVNTGITRLGAIYPNSKKVVGGIAADLSNSETIEAELIKVFDAAITFFGRPIDHIVITAGGPSPPQALAEFEPTKAFDHATLRILLPMVIGKLIAKFPGKYVKAASTSSITVTSGILGKKPRKNTSTWLFTSGALDTVRRCLSIDLAPIRTNAIVPGAVSTELLDRFPAEARDQMKAGTLTKELGTAPDLAEAYLHCMRSKFMVGEEMVVDGGFLIM